MEDPSSARPPGEGRFTYGLIADVFDVLHARGYAQPTGPAADQAAAAAMLAVFGLTRAYEGVTAEPPAVDDLLAALGQAHTPEPPGSAIPDRPGLVMGECGHSVSENEWRAGYRGCDRCPLVPELDDRHEHTTGTAAPSPRAETPSLPAGGSVLYPLAEIGDGDGDRVAVGVDGFGVVVDVFTDFGHTMDTVSVPPALAATLARALGVLLNVLDPYDSRFVEQLGRFGTALAEGAALATGDQDDADHDAVAVADADGDGDGEVTS
jgi:hypothetical protein